MSKLDDTRCEKVPHIFSMGGYLHADDDDSPYDVDGVAYCGRCHVAMAAHFTPDEKQRQ